MPKRKMNDLQMPLRLGAPAPLDMDPMTRRNVIDILIALLLQASSTPKVAMEVDREGD